MMINMSDIHAEITDRICELENYIEGFSQEDLKDIECLFEVANAKIAVNKLEEARNILDEYLY